MHGLALREYVNVVRERFDLRNQEELVKGFNASLEETWKTSAVIQYDYQNAIIPCVTVNVPFGPVQKGILNVSFFRIVDFSFLQI